MKYGKDARKWISVPKNADCYRIEDTETGYKIVFYDSNKLFAEPNEAKAFKNMGTDLFIIPQIWRGKVISCSETVEGYSETAGEDKGYCHSFYIGIDK